MNRTSPWALIFLAILLPCIAGAQVHILPADSLIDRRTRDHLVKVQGWADYNSNSINNELPWNIYRGGFISRELRQRSSNGLRDRNSMGYDIGAMITWSGADSLFGKPRLRPLISVGHRGLLGVEFTRDVYDMAFFGNAQFEDRTARLGPSAHTQMAWQEVAFGVEDARTSSFVQLKLLRGRSYNASEIRKADLYTVPDGRALDLMLDAQYWQQDTAGREIEHANGAGLAISASYRFLTTLAGRRSTISVDVRDAGFISWNPNSVSIVRDTAAVFEGLQVENIFDLGSVIVGEGQYLDTFGLRYQRGSYTTPTPFHAGTTVLMGIDDAWRAGLTAEYRYLPGYRPQFTGRLARVFGSRSLLGSTVTYGGFGNFRWGLAYKVRLGEVILVELGSPHLPGLFLGTAHGVGAYMNLSFMF